jgi:hypothetical protein
MWHRLRHRLIGIDLVTGAMAAALSLLVALFARRIPHAGIYLAYHALWLALVGLLIYAAAFTARPFWKLLRHWYPLLLVPAVFYELHYLIPHLRPRRCDALLAAWDRALFGDVARALEPLIAHPWVVDLLHLCYWTYFVTPIALAAVLYAADVRAYRAALTICVLGWYLSYLGYLVLPANGPYSLPGEPLPQGRWVAPVSHPKLLELEWNVPTAFPSGHVLTILLVLFCAWRWRRRFFWIALAPSLGLILSTVALRYHYLVDLVASLALAGPIAWAGLRIHARAERWSA